MNERVSKDEIKAENKQRDQTRNSERVTETNEKLVHDPVPYRLTTAYLGMEKDRREPVLELSPALIEERGAVFSERRFGRKWGNEVLLVVREVSAQGQVQLFERAVALMCMDSSTLFGFDDTVVHNIGPSKLVSYTCPPTDLNLASKRKAFPHIVA